MKHKMIRLFLVFALVSPLWAQTLETRVGNQIWAGVNLDVARFRNGDVIPEAKTKEAWLRAAAKKQPAWCYYENKTDNGRHFGKLYNWYAVNDPRGLAPEGWHIASEEEWEELFRHLAGKSIAGLALKTREGWLQDGNGTDVVGFHAMPGGSPLWLYRLGASGAQRFVCGMVCSNDESGEALRIHQEFFNNIDKWRTETMGPQLPVLSGGEKKENPKESQHSLIADHTSGKQPPDQIIK